MEVVDADINENFDSESKARERFTELIAERFDHEVVKLYCIGDDGTQIPEGTQRGKKRLTG